MKRIICLLISVACMLGYIGVDLAYAETKEIEELVKNLEIGESIDYRNLSLMPIYAKAGKDKTNYLTLDEAVTKGYITITELEGGRVPQVKINNSSGHYIILVAGEILSGCKQDRLVGRDALIGPKSKGVILPVYCSEQGRWTPKSPAFYSEKNQAEPVLRKMLYGKASQHEIWDRIADFSKVVGVRSETQALQDVYRDKEKAGVIQEFASRLENIPRLEEDAVGVVVGIGDRIIAVDIFANPMVFARLWPKLLKSYAALAISEENNNGTLSQRQAKDLLNEIYRMKFSAQKGLDLGVDFQASSPCVMCSALVYRGNVVHLAAFPEGQEGPPGNRGNRIQVIDFD